MDRTRTSRRSFLKLAAAAPLAVTALSACGGSSGPGQASANDASMWILSGQPGEGIRTGAVDAYNSAGGGGRVVLTSFQADAYKARIRTALGADQGPTLIWTWGGGGLRDYVRNGEVEDLTGFFDEHPALRERIFPTAFTAATVDGRIYAVPCEQSAPVVLFYNRTLFDQVGAQPPTTWDELMALVPVFNDAGVAPFSLAGQSRWTNMMWLEYLFDRIGGPEVFAAILAGEPTAWSHPAAIDALTRIQDLVRAGGFVNGFQSITADSSADEALLYTGRAAMMLHLPRTYGSVKASAGDFVTGGDLGYVPFPAVAGGAGDPTNCVGNPAGYYALSSRAGDQSKVVARDFLADGLITDATTRAWIDAGGVPVTADGGFAGSDDAEWLRFVYDLSSQAPHFEQSWDQALAPSVAETMLNNIEQLFGLGITPQQFGTNLNAVQVR